MINFVIMLSVLIGSNMWTKIFLFFILFGFTQCQDGENNSSTSDVPVVNVTQGWLRGEVLELVTGDGTYYSFKGIPYATPPVGELRFKAPQPPLSWDGIRNATSHGASCIQSNASSAVCEAIELTQDEDCLFLNVYTGNLAENASLPVMVFIHGGGYTSGSGDEQFYGPDFLLNHGVVVVTINYRLGALGFLCLDTEDVPGNAGLKDQVAALKWVKENIKSFGGDPDLVTIFGQSAGGGAVSFHVLSPMSKGLFKRAIPMSGCALGDWNLPHQPVRRAFMLGKLLGNETDDPNVLLDFLQSVSADKLVDISTTIFASEEITMNPLKMFYFPPVVEKKFDSEGFLTESPSEILKQGNINDVDVLIGHTSDESLALISTVVQYTDLYDRYPELLVPTGILINSTQDTIIETADRIHKYYFGEKRIDISILGELARYITDSMIIYTTDEFASRLAKIGNAKLFFYLFTCYSGRNFFGATARNTYNLTGVAHADDTAYLFNLKSCNSTIDTSTREYTLIQFVNTVFTNFAKYGTPTPDSSLNVTWPEYDNSSRQYAEIGDELTIKEFYKPEMLDFWRSIYETAKIPL